MNHVAPAPKKGALLRDPDWWRGAVIYQIYPRSYQDSNEDGIGDLPGITARLPHIAALGADAVWISPFFRSPMLDFGYDVSDYRDVDPIFGTLADFDALIEEAHKLGLRVMIDLVLSHSSDQHPWFAESRASRDNSRANWYVWADAKPDGTAPNNWLSIFGGPAWAWEPERQQYYLHNFLKEQPDLNFHEPQVQDALLDVARFWMARGVDGFRLDTINFYFHDAELRSNPPLPEEARNATIAPAVNPYNHQDHLYDKNRPENLAFLERLRAAMDDYPDMAAVGEVGDAQNGLEIAGQYTEGDRRMHMCYAFEFLGPERLTGAATAATLQNFEQKAPEGWACWAFSNHDVVRHASRWGLCDAARRAYLGLLLCLRGSVCLYQGEELGLAEAEIAFEDLQDPYGKAFWPKFKGRDGCRTPMVWENRPGGGFTGARPWLPVPEAHLPLAAAEQTGVQGSMLEFYRNLLFFRREFPALAKGSLRFGDVGEDHVSFTREWEGTRLFAAFNLSGQPCALAAPGGADLGLPGFAVERRDGKLVLPPWQGCLIRLEGE